MANDTNPNADLELLYNLIREVLNATNATLLTVSLHRDRDTITFHTVWEREGIGETDLNCIVTIRKLKIEYALNDLLLETTERIKQEYQKNRGRI